MFGNKNLKGGIMTMEKGTRLARLLLVVGTSFVLAAPAVAIAQVITCESLGTAGMFNDTIVTLATNVAANPTTGVPAHCRVVATIKPTPGSNIGVEYRLPTPWNGKFLGIGGGGFGGSISAGGFTEGLQRGYAAAQTNIGHTNADGVAWALTAPGVPNGDRVTDYDYRSVRLMTTVGKAIVLAYYGNDPDYSYWQGCSTGGREGMIEAQRFPKDYDGIIAGDPVYTTRLQLGTVERVNQFHRQPGSALTSELLPIINKAVLDACDAKDGLLDGVIDDPRRCKWDPAELQCSATSGSACLTSAQVEALRNVYKGTITADGKLLYEGIPRGSELNWQSRYVDDASNSIGGQMAKYMVFLDPNYDPKTFNINNDNDVAMWDNAQVSLEGNADDPEISEFVKRGGKMILYHGSYDPGPSPLSTIQYYKEVVDVVGRNKDLKKSNPGNRADRVRESVRLFLVPGMYHCAGGPGANEFDTLTPLEQWVEQGIAPDSIFAINSDSGISRPLCVYPQVARYTGRGDPNDADNFVCVTGHGKGDVDGKQK
jgi:feruloyl esterase